MSGVVSVGLLGISLIMLLYSIRHFMFGVNRLFCRQKPGFEGVQEAPWPRLTVFIAAHNEESVVGCCIEALLKTDYPRDRLCIMPVNDRSTDGTRAVCDQWSERYPHLVKPFHRSSGRAGKPAALMDAARRAPESDVYVIFDADYLPGPGLLKQIVAPLFDPQVGVTMGRVVPLNVGRNLLTRLLDMERSAGYQGDQQARQNLGLLPQYGGTVGAIKVRALQAVGGFREDVLAEDTDLTFRMLEKGWRVQYVNTAECYEEVPETWPVRVRQLQRWAKGHNQVMYSYLCRVIRNRHLSTLQKADALMLLGCYAVAPLTLVGWGIVLFTWNAQPGWLLTLSVTAMTLVMYGGFGNLAAFFQMAVAVRLDGHGRRLRLLPLGLIGYLVSVVTITRGMISLVIDSILKRELRWDKTARFRSPGNN
ncbi:UNVERIFIED_ORG: cellulose synthase/poly-beta-1,6-N-acetylglucosamine synthase-like glycosyltransferase [Citrobacter freundii]